MALNLFLNNIQPTNLDCLYCFRNNLVMLVYSIEYNLSFMVPDVVIGIILFYQLIKRSPSIVKEQGS